MKRYKVWNPENGDEPTDFNAEGFTPKMTAENWAEKEDPFLDGGDYMDVHIRDEKGDLHTFIVEVEIERSFHAFEEKD